LLTARSKKIRKLRVCKAVNVRTFMQAEILLFKFAVGRTICCYNVCGEIKVLISVHEVSMSYLF